MNTLLKSALMLSLLCLSITSCGQDETFEPPKGEGPWILVDLYHTRIQNPEDYRLTKTEYNYQGTYGYARVFDHLEDNGYKWRSIRELELSPARLKGFDVLFINLVHEERPDFSEDEVEAIKDFVAQGGGLFVISDHTNVYYHAQRINAFLNPMGINVTYHSALEPGEQSLSGLGWIAIEDFTEHPTNYGVDLLGFQTGGPMRSLDPAKAQGTALTSSSAYEDFWDESTGAGFYGDWALDIDSGLEARGPFPVAMAANYGKGRVMVVGDQNIYGDAFVHFGDNFRHVMNSFEWLAKQRQLSPTPLADIKPAGFNIGVDARLNKRAIASGAKDNYYTFFINFNRDQEVTGRGITRLDQQDDALILPSPKQEVSADDLEDIVNYLDDGKKVVLTFELNQLDQNTYRPTLDLLKKLAPDFSVQIEGGTTIRLTDTSENIASTLSAANFQKLTSPSTLQSSRLDVDGIELASVDLQTTSESSTRTPYLLKLRSAWGEPLLATAEGDYTIARSKRLGNGELIIFVQDGFWRNRTTGESESDPPTAEATQATNLQYALIDYLKKPLLPCASNCNDLPELSLLPTGDGFKVLVDLYHTRKQNHEDYALKKNNYDYQGTHGYSRAFAHLGSHGYNVASTRTQPLTTEALTGFDVLFINLVHEERPDFSEDEVEAIKDFVAQGGGLFVISDHTNVYYHAQRINAFLNPMGIDVTYHTAIDYAEHQITGLAWIAIDDLTTHPINEGIETISFQTGGTMAEPEAGGDAVVTARLSERGYGDYWDESSGVGFYGNWKHDDDLTIEPMGSLPVGMASEYGAGRVVVVGDQNMFGDVWLHMTDNFEHWLNIYQWLARDDDRQAPLRNTKPAGFNLGVDMRYAYNTPGNTAPENYYSFFVNINRDQNFTGRALKRWDKNVDALILPPARAPYDDEAVEHILNELAQGKRVVILSEMDNLLRGDQLSYTAQLLTQIAPDFSVTTDDHEIKFNQSNESLTLDIMTHPIARQEGLLDVRSSKIALNNTTLLGNYPQARTGEDPTSYFIQASSNWGDALLTSEQGVDIARSARVNGGELIIFLQDGFWRNRTIGKSEVDVPHIRSIPAIELQYRFMEYLRSPVS